MDERLFLRAWSILLLVAGWLLIYPLVYNQVDFLRAHTKHYRPFAWVVRPASSAILAPNSTVFFWENSFASGDDNTDPEATTFLPPMLLPQDSNLWERLIQDPYYTGWDNLKSFFAGLRQSRSDQLRIAYYGDSSIEGDLITQTLRDSLQQQFGGKGVGFVPIAARNPGFRRSVRHFFSHNWYHNTLNKSNWKNLNPGINAEYFTAMDGSETQAYLARLQSSDTLETKDTSATSLDAPEPSHWVSYRSSKWFAGTQTFPQVRLWYGTPPQLDSVNTEPLGWISAQLDNQELEFPLYCQAPVNEVLLSAEPVSRVRVSFRIPVDLPVYGFSFESNEGVIIDNFSSRGNSGIGLLRIAPEVLTTFQSHMDYDLLVLQFGLNVLNPKLLDYDWYEDQLISVIRHYQAAWPGVPVLIIGVPDKATQWGGAMQTDPSIPRITAAQRAAAVRCRAGFFSLYEAMGGAGTMVNWVDGRQPRLANLDYTHFNFIGADRVGNLILDYLRTGYTAYQAETQLSHVDQ